jgi:hypothetical protein
MMSPLDRARLQNQALAMRYRERAAWTRPELQMGLRLEYAREVAGNIRLAELNMPLWEKRMAELKNRQAQLLSVESSGTSSNTSPPRAVHIYDNVSPEEKSPQAHAATAAAEAVSEKAEPVYHELEDTCVDVFAKLLVRPYVFLCVMV